MSRLPRINKNTSVLLKNLSNLAENFPAPVSNILKTSYMARCDSIETISNNENYLTIICPVCKIDISESANFNLIPKKCDRFEKFVRKRIEDGSQLTQYQKRYAKNMPVTSNDGQIVFNITCNICKKRTKKVLTKWKQKVLKRKATDEPNSTEVAESQPKKKKKRKKIDQSCGLNTDAIQSAKAKNPPFVKQNKPNKILSKITELESQKPIIVNNIAYKKKKYKNNPRSNQTKESLKNKNKLGQILGISLAHNSAKSSNLNQFFDSF